MYEQLVLGGDKWWTKHSVKLGLTSKWFILKIIIILLLIITMLIAYQVILNMTCLKIKSF